MSTSIQLGPFGGELPKPDSALQKPSIASKAIDCYIDTGALRPVRTDRKVSDETGDYIYTGSCCVKTLKGCKDIAVTDVGCDRVFVGAGQYPTYASHDRYCKGILTRLDWQCSAPAPTVLYTNSLVQAVDQYTLADGSVITKGLATVRSYFWTFRNYYGDESPPCEVSRVVIKDFNSVAILSGFAPPDPANHATERVIYAMVAGVEDGSGAVGAGEDQYFRIATIPLTQDTFVHIPSTMQLQDAFVNEGQSPVSQSAHSLQWLQDDRLAYLSNDRLHFTEPGNYTSVHDKYTLAFRDKPLKFVTTERIGYVLTCGRPEVVDITKKCDGDGCKNITTIDEHLPLIGGQSTCTYQGGVFYASTKGIVAISGVNANVITDDIFTQDQWDALLPHEIKTVIHRGFLYIVSPITTYRLKLSSTAYSKPDIADMVQLSIRPTAITVTHDDRLLFADSLGTWEMEQGVGLKPYTWSRRFDLRSYSSPGAVRLSYHKGHVDMTETRIGSVGAYTVKTYSNLPSNRTIRLGRVATPEYEITLTGTAELYAVKFTGSPREM